MRYEGEVNLQIRSRREGSGLPCIVTHHAVLRRIRLKELFLVGRDINLVGCNQHVVVE